MEAHIQDVEKHALLAALAAVEARRRFHDESQQQAARIAELEGLLVNRDLEIQKLQAEVEALKVGKGLETDWLLAEFGKACKEIMEGCGGDASLYEEEEVLTKMEGLFY